MPVKIAQRQNDRKARHTSIKKLALARLAEIDVYIGRIQALGHVLFRQCHAERLVYIVDLDLRLGQEGRRGIRLPLQACKRLAFLHQRARVVLILAVPQAGGRWAEGFEDVRAVFDDLLLAVDNYHHFDGAFVACDRGVGAKRAALDRAGVGAYFAIDRAAGDGAAVGYRHAAERAAGDLFIVDHQLAGERTAADLALEIEHRAAERAVGDGAVVLYGPDAERAVGDGATVDHIDTRNATPRVERAAGNGAIVFHPASDRAAGDGAVIVEISVFRDRDVAGEGFIIFQSSAIQDCDGARKIRLQNELRALADFDALDDACNKGIDCAAHHISARHRQRAVVGERPTLAVFRRQHGVRQRGVSVTRICGRETPSKSA